MKHVVSVSIGSSKRNHKVTIELLGEEFIIERIGTDGDLGRAIDLVKELDGKIDAFGMGGIDLYIHSGGRRYTFRDAQRMAFGAKVTPIVDGSGLKNSLERWTVEYLHNDLGMTLEGKKVLMVAGVDRFGMAEAFVEAGCEMLFGDAIFALGWPLKLRTLQQLSWAARILLPLLTRLPFKLLYPTGEKQDEIKPKHSQYYAWADIIAGDWHFIRRYMPDQMKGKTIITNTLTKDNVQELKERGVAVLVTTTPDLNGRSFGTNVIEAALVALSGKKPEELQADDYLRLLNEINFKPRVESWVPSAADDNK
jgi:hypothetical protein